MEPVCRIRMLGGLRARVRDREIARFRTQKTGALLAYLAYHREQLHPREVLAEMLWPWSAPTAGRKSLSMALSSLRSQLEPPGIDAGSVILADRQSVGLSPATVTTDVTEFHALLRRAEVAGSDAERLQCTAEAVALYRGPLLPGYYQDWLLPEQRRLADAYFAALRHLTNELAARGDYQSAIDHARQAVSFDPVREGAHEHLIRLLIAAGDPVAAVRQYEELEQVLEEQLSEQPSAALRELRRELPATPTRQRGDPLPMPRPFAPLDTPDQTLRGTIALLLGEVLSGDGNGSQANGTDSKSIQEARELVSGVAARHGGHAANGAGDTLAFAFGRPSDALAAAIECQRGMGESCRERPGVVQLRLALDTGEAQPVGGSYRGPLLDRATGILLATHPGQILCSEAAAGILRSGLPPDVALVDLGFFGLRTVEAPERLFTVEHPDVTRAAFPPPNAALAHRSNLPSQFTRFFGREAELARVKDLLASDGAQLITLTGSGGSGKTRLTIEAARAALGPFRGAVWFVALQELTDADLLPRAVVGAVGAPPLPDLEPLDQAVGLLSRQPSLLVLDNFEHLVDGGALIVRDLVERVSELKVLVTSRRCLSVSGETELPLGPLPTPTGEAGAEELVRCPSVQLFVDRAQTAKPDFQVTKLNAPAISELCERLEGIPLALELAGARAQVLTPSQMLEQMAERFGFLVTRKRDVADRHRTLWAALDWSYQLLTPELQRFLSRLSVFRGGWTADAAAAVCDEPRALDFLQQLRDASLVTSLAHHGKMCFGLLDSTREFAWQKLSAEERDALAERHADYYLAAAEGADGPTPATDGGTRLARLESGYDNLRAALRWLAAAEGKAEAGLRLAAALGRFWSVGRHTAEGWGWMEKMLTRPGAQAPTPARARALQQAGGLATPPAAGVPLFEEALGIYRERGDQAGVLLCLTGLGNAALLSPAGRDESERLFRQALAMARDAGDEGAEAGCLRSLSHLARDRLEYTEAQTLARQAIAISRRLGDRRGMAGALNNLGYALWPVNKYEEAYGLHKEALAVFRAAGDKPGTGNTLKMLSAVARRMGRTNESRAYLEEDLALYREFGNTRGEAMAVEGMGLTARQEGDLGAAERFFTEALTLHREAGNQWGVASCLSSLGNLARARGQLEEARECVQSALAIKQEVEPQHVDCHDLLLLGSVALLQEDWAEARARLTEAAVGALERDYHETAATALCSLGIAACLEGDCSKARAHLGEALAVFRIDDGDWHIADRLLEAMALVCAREGRPERGARLVGAAEVLGQKARPSRAAFPCTEYDYALQSVRSMLDEQTFEAERAKGHAMDRQQAIAYALQTDDPRDAPA